MWRGRTGNAVDAGAGAGVPASILCLDHDAAGIEATGRLKEILAERGYAETAVLQSIHKDWNEDVKARCGLEAQSAEEHPQLMAGARGL